MDAIAPLPTEQVNLPQAATPVQLSASDKHTQNVNRTIQTAAAVLKTILSGIARVVQEIAGLLLRR